MHGEGEREDGTSGDVVEPRLETQREVVELDGTVTAGDDYVLIDDVHAVDTALGDFDDLGGGTHEFVKVAWVLEECECVAALPHDGVSVVGAGHGRLGLGDEHCRYTADGG